MFKITKEISNCAGVQFPAGLLVGYRHHTDLDQRKIRTQFFVWQNVEAFQSRSNPIPASGIGIFNESVGDNPLADFSLLKLPPMSADTYDKVLDDLAVLSFLTITHGLTESNIEKVGQLPLDNMQEPQPDNQL
jgi:hypothetical protein